MAALFFVIMIGILTILGLIGLIAYLFGKDEKVKEDYNFGFSFMPHLHRHRAFGKEINVETGEDGRIITTLKPMDLSPKTIKESLKKVKNERVITTKFNKITLPKGSYYSKEKNISLYLPDKAEDLSPEIRNHPFGKFLAYYIELTKADDAAIQALMEGIDRQKSHLIKMGWGEVSIQRMNYLSGLHKESLGLLKEAKGTKSSGIINPTGIPSITGG